MSPRKKSPAVTMGNDAPVTPTRSSSRIRALSAKVIEVANPIANDANGTIGLVAARKTPEKRAQEGIDTDPEGDGHGDSGRVGGSDVGNLARKNTRASRGSANLKKGKAEKGLDAIEGEEEKPVAMKGCCATKANAKTGLKAEAARKTDPAVKVEDVAVDEDDNNPTTKKPASKKRSNKESASKKPASVKLESKVAEKPETRESPWTMVVVKHSKAPHVDRGSELNHSHEVLVTADEVWDATLNQTDIGNNVNKFYILQILHPVGNNSQATLFRRSGRVGAKGRTEVKGPWPPETAIQEFKKLFKARAAVDWEERVEMVQKTGKYQWIEKLYEDDEEDKEEMSVAGSKKQKEEKIPESTLGPELQQLIKLIFDQSLFAATLSSLNYDANKLPLGKLAQSTIQHGFSVLKALSEVISEPDGNVSKLQAIERLTSNYYSIIPHIFGRSRPTTINTPEQLQHEFELVDTLDDIEIATRLLSELSAIPRDPLGNPRNPLDAKFSSLGLSSMEPVARVSREWGALEAYIRDTHGAADSHYGVQLLNAFRLEREGERRAWEENGCGGVGVGKRLLLWHGSRTANVVGILKQGLRIAPPKTHANGSKFGKGVYFADMMSNSANYCHAKLSDNTGILLLCEVVVKPFLKVYDTNCNADKDCQEANAKATKALGRTQPAKWQDAGYVLDHPELKGCHMPKGPAKDVSDPKVNEELLYNEYIVYNTSQIRIRYLLMVKIEERRPQKAEESHI